MYIYIKFLNTGLWRLVLRGTFTIQLPHLKLRKHHQGLERTIVRTGWSDTDVRFLSPSNVISNTYTVSLTWLPQNELNNDNSNRHLNMMEFNDNRSPGYLSVMNKVEVRSLLELWYDSKCCKDKKNSSY